MSPCHAPVGLHVCKEAAPRLRPAGKARAGSDTVPIMSELATLGYED